MQFLYIFLFAQIFDPRDYTVEYLKNHDPCDVQYVKPKNQDEENKMAIDEDDCEYDLKTDKKLFLGKSTIF